MLPKKFKKRPVVIEAVQWDGTSGGASTVIDWIEGNEGCARYRCAPGGCTGTEEGHYVAIETLEGTVSASAGDFIIRGVQGEFYPCRSDIFADTYVPAEGAHHHHHPERNQEMSLNAYRDQCGKAAVRNGWHDRYLDIDIHGDEVLDHLVAKTALISCEVSEAIEELRSGHTPNEVYESAGGKPEGYPTELADIIIRTLDLAYMLSIDIDAAVQEKLAFNTTRGHKHGKTI